MSDISQASSQDLSSLIKPIKIDGKYGYVNLSTSTIAISPQFDNVGFFFKEIARVMVDEKWGFIDTSGSFIILPQFEDTYCFFLESLAKVKVDNKWGLIDLSGKFIVSPQFDYIDTSRDKW